MPENLTQEMAQDEKLVTLKMEDFKALMQESVKSVITNLGLDKTDLKHEVFPGQDNPEDLKKSAVERQAEFFRALVQGDVQTIKRLYAGQSLTDASGGYLVPQEFINEVIRLIPSYGLARRLCRMINMNTDSLVIPKYSSGMTLYWPAEAAAITQSAITASQVSFTPKKAAILIPTTNELLADTNLLVSLLSDLAAENFAGGEDNQLFNGTGSSPVITGIFVSSNVTKTTMGTGRTSLADMSYEDIIDVEHSIDPNYLEGATWIMHRSAFKYARKLKDDAGQYIYVRPESLLDMYPVTLTEKGPTTVTTANKGQIALGNLKRSHIFADRQMMSVKILSETYIDSDTNLGTMDMSAFRFIERIDIQEANPTAVGVLWTASS